MIISIVAALGKNGQLGLNGRLVWSIGDDMRNFKNLTSGHHILMGRKTFQSIGRALPNRKNLVLGRGDNLVSRDIYVFTTPMDAVDFAQNNGESELFVIGGAIVYEFFITRGLVDKMYLTDVDYDGEADVFFPKFDKANWNSVEIGHFARGEKNEYSGRFKILTRN
ncbi:MAG: dihydrofolate reductase [Rickettsiales bacterium]|jgi:dihydrofolate reductase|nr:dihydrofolate reductase [Rickettsiales bacterium]